MAQTDAALVLTASVQTELASTDARIEGWIEQASAVIADYIGHALQKGTRTEKAAGNNWPFLMTPTTPIISITSIAYGTDSTVDSGDYEVDNADAGAIYMIGSPALRYAYAGEGVARDAVGGTERKMYTIVHVCGYVTPVQNAAGTYVGQTVTLPQAIQRACIMLVADYAARSGIGSSVKSVSLLSHSVTFADPSDGSDDGEFAGHIPAGVRAMLRPYRVVRQA
jgi:hypothetical protein